MNLRKINIYYIYIIYIEVIFDLIVTCHMSQCHKPKTIIKYLIMNRLADGHDDAVSRCIDEFFGFAPYGKGESVYDQSHKWEPVRWA